MQKQEFEERIERTVTDEQYKVIEEVYMWHELQVEVDPEDIETSITNIQEQLNTPVEDAVRDKIISSGSVTIDTENLNILVDEKLDINITYVPMGHVREMNLTFAVENPYSAS